MSLCLNVGCHDIQIENFINIDIDPNMKPDVIHDATKLRDLYQDESVDFIYCGHFLEHLKIDEGLKLVKDFYYLLKPYGTIVTVIPDFTKVDVSNINECESVILAGGLHKTIYNEKRLLEVFSINGFTVFPVSTERLPWCMFPYVIWQSSIIAIKHNSIKFKN